ncbi:MerR family transcriptional regulator [Plantactinospora sp. B24E8]|uniref:MerR family transcriptional regulator n=1 Tax=Plantactinospora sp. B24E8 TaxID=3153567 RepID=UPI00325EEA2F
MNTYPPSVAAERTGFSLDTLRYYERIGLLSEISRTSGGRRVFTEDDLGWLDVLRCLRDTGMPIAQVRRYAELARDGETTLAERLALLEEHSRAVEERMNLLRHQYAHLQDKIAWYRGQLD